MKPQPPSPGWTDWSTGYCIEVPLARKKLSAYLLLPVGAFTPTPSATLPLACVWGFNNQARSEEHTSELQSQSNLVCRLLLEKKKKIEKRSQSYVRCMKNERISCDPQLS